MRLFFSSLEAHLAGPGKLCRERLAISAVDPPGKLRGQGLESSPFQSAPRKLNSGSLEHWIGLQLSQLHPCRLRQPTPCQEIAINCSGHSESVGCNREGRVDRSTRWHERTICNKEIGDAMRPAVSIDHSGRGIVAHHTGSAGMSEVQPDLFLEKNQVLSFQTIG